MGTFLSYIYSLVHEINIIAFTKRVYSNFLFTR